MSDEELYDKLMGEVQRSAGYDEVSQTFWDAIDESRRRREAGEPGNVKVTAWEVLPDGERVEIKHD